MTTAQQDARIKKWKGRYPHKPYGNAPTEGVAVERLISMVKRLPSSTRAVMLVDLDKLFSFTASIEDALEDILRKSNDADLNI